jgi:hypothetical protein
MTYCIPDPIQARIATIGQCDSYDASSPPELLFSVGKPGFWLQSSADGLF